MLLLVLLLLLLLLLLRPMLFEAIISVWYVFGAVIAIGGPNTSSSFVLARLAQPLKECQLRWRPCVSIANTLRICGGECRWRGAGAWGRRSGS